MSHPHHLQHRHVPRHRLSGTRRFLLVLWRFVTYPLRALWKMIKGARSNKQMVKLTILAGVVAAAVGALVLLITIAVVSRGLPDPNKLIDRQVAQSTKIYDRTGEHLLYEISGDQKRTVIDIKNLPLYVPQSVIALEDKTFYQHSGFNYQRLGKAVLLRLVGQSGPGASTLTSQLVKNAILSPEKTLLRKLKEWILVFQIERKYTKDEILQLYLNEIPYGSTAYGVEAASNYYFGKSAEDLTLAEAATMAAIIQLPSYYSPYGTHKDALLKRKDLCLYLMEEQGYITEEEMNTAKAQELAFKERRENIDAPHFVFYVRDLLVQKYGEHLVNRGGLVVRTTLDYDKQTLAEEAIEARVEFNTGFNASNASLVSIDPQTGEILAMVGSIDYFNDEIDGQFNVATSPRQPGSSFKPIMYTVAWQRGYTPSTVIFDVNTDFPGNGKLYQPKNYDLKEHGPVSLRNALQGSLNIPAVKMLYMVGVNNVLDFAEELGYTTLGDRERFGLSLVLGGGEVTLLEHTAAYATLAADGMYHEPLALLEVKTNAGQMLDEFKPKERRAIDANIARITSNVLSDNQARAYIFGTSSGLSLGDRPAAAKTGTTNDYRDAWTLGYVPQLATGVWVGNNDFTEMKRGGGSSLAAPIWNAYMTKALKGVPVQGFVTPQIPVPDKPILSGQGFGAKQVTIDRASGKLATEFTPESFREEKLYIDAHDILYYVDKRNPTGPAPADPAAADPQYTTWETAVQNWIKAKIEKNEPIFTKENVTYPEGMTVEYGVPPTEYDDVHVDTNKPTIVSMTPSSDMTINERFINASVEATGPRGVSRVEFYFDNSLLATDAVEPFQANISLKSFQNGFYRFRAVAYDDVDNSVESSVRIQLQSDEAFIGMTWETPTDGEQIAYDAETVLLRMQVTSEDKVSQVTFFAADLATREELLVSAVVAPTNNRVTVNWKPVHAGHYRLFAKVSISGVGILTSPAILVEVLPPPEPIVDGR